MLQGQGGSPYGHGRAEQWSSLSKDECVSLDQAEQWSSHHDESSSQNTQPITRCPTITGSVARYVDRPVINMHDQEITFVQIQGIDGRAEQLDTNTLRMAEGCQAEQDQVELSRIDAEPGEQEQMGSRAEQVSVEMGRDQAEQRSMPGRAGSLRSSNNTQLVTRCPTIPGSVARYVECPELNFSNENLNCVHPPSLRKGRVGLRQRQLDFNPLDNLETTRRELDICADKLEGGRQTGPK